MTLTLSGITTFLHLEPLNAPFPIIFTPSTTKTLPSMVAYCGKDKPSALSAILSPFLFALPDIGGAFLLQKRE